MCSERCKNHGCGQKKPKSTSSAIFGVETAAKSRELKRCADRVCNRTNEANLNFSPELYRLNGTFRLPPKRQLSILLNFFPLTNLFLSFVVFACFATTRVNMRFHAKNTGFSTGLYPVYEVYW